MSDKEFIKYLEQAWEPGVLYEIRQGVYDSVRASQFLAKMRGFSPEDDSGEIDRRLVSLLWYLPLFLSWQHDRIVDRGGDLQDFCRFENAVEAEIEKILGIP